jgi:hypothetical protein
MYFGELYCRFCVDDVEPNYYVKCLKVLNMAWERGFEAVNLRIDSQVVLHNMKTGSDSMLQQIRSLFELD